MPFYFPCAINIYDDCSGFNENIVVIAIVKASTMWHFQLLNRVIKKNAEKKEKIEIETGFADCNGKMKVDKCEIKIDSVHKNTNLKWDAQGRE